MVSIAAERESAHDDQLDAIFHALSDRTRRQLIRNLSNGPAVIKQLAGPFDMSFAAVSKHLRVLESAKLIKRDVDGRFHRCTLTAEPMLQADRWLQHYTAFWEDNLDSLAEFVDRATARPHDE